MEHTQQQGTEQQQQRQALVQTQTAAALNPAPAVVVGLDSPDDAALVTPPPPGYLMIHTVDFFRSFWDDAYVLGRIAANHALGVKYWVLAQHVFP